MSQAFRLGWVSWARRTPGAIPRLDLSMLIFSSIFSLFILIITMLAVLRLLLIHWLNARACAVVLFTYRWSYGLGLTRYMPGLLKP